MGARERRRFIIRRDRMEKRILCHRFPPFSLLSYRVPRKGATRIDPSVARDESPANAPPKQIFAPRKRNISPIPLSTFLKRFCRCSTHFRFQSRRIRSTSDRLTLVSIFPSIVIQRGMIVSKRNVERKKKYKNLEPILGIEISSVSTPPPSNLFGGRTSPRR